MLKNNNPGNIRLIKQSGGGYGAAFVGEVRPGDIAPGSTYGFRKFDTLVNGFRAMFVLLKRSYLDNGFNTIAKILPRYAPAADANNPNAYINTVEALTGIDRNQVLSSYTDLLPIVKAMAKVETGATINAADASQALASIYNPLLITTTAASDTTPGAKKNYKKILIPAAAMVAALYLLNGNKIQGAPGW